MCAVEGARVHVYEATHTFPFFFTPPPPHAAVASTVFFSFLHHQTHRDKESHGRNDSMPALCALSSSPSPLP